MRHPVTGEWLPNITCHLCKHRHWTNVTCAEAASEAQDNTRTTMADFASPATFAQPTFHLRWIRRLGLSPERRLVQWWTFVGGQPEAKPIEGQGEWREVPEIPYGKPIV